MPQTNGPQSVVSGSQQHQCLPGTLIEHILGLHLRPTESETGFDTSNLCFNKTFRGSHAEQSLCTTDLDI